MFLAELRAMTMMIEMLKKMIKTKMIKIRTIKIYPKCNFKDYLKLNQLKWWAIVARAEGGTPHPSPPLRPFPTKNKVEKKITPILYNTIIGSLEGQTLTLTWALEGSSCKFLLISIRRLLINSQRNQYWILKVHFIILNLGNSKNI